jgi:hypothetical protein
MTALGTVALATLGVARAAIEFVGILATPQRTLFALTNTDSGKTAWIETGKEFDGFKVIRFDAAVDTLTIVGAVGQETQLRLKDDAKIKSARLDLSGTITFGIGEQLEVVRATLPFGEETVLPLKDGLVCKVTPHRLENGHLEFRAVFERVLAENKSERIAAPRVTVLPGRPFSIKIGDIGFSFSPK